MGMENTAVVTTEACFHTELPSHHSKALSGMGILSEVEKEGPKAIDIPLKSSFTSIDVLKTAENGDITVNSTSVLNEKDPNRDNNNRSSIIPPLSPKGCLSSGLCGRPDYTSENPKHKLKDDYGLLLRGFDLVSTSLARLRGNIDRAQKHAKRPTAEKSQESQDDETGEENVVRNGIRKNPVDTNKKTRLVASKISFFAKEVRKARSEVCFMKKRCSVMEEENKTLNDRMRAAAADDEDMMRLQLEVLHAEKSRLANENTELTKDNDYLQGLLEYLRSNSQDLPEDESLR